MSESWHNESRRSRCSFPGWLFSLGDAAGVLFDLAGLFWIELSVMDINETTETELEALVGSHNCCCWNKWTHTHVILIWLFLDTIGLIHESIDHRR
jgi:hypothetical protein